MPRVFHTTVLHYIVAVVYNFLPACNARIPISIWSALWIPYCNVIWIDEGLSLNFRLNFKFQHQFQISICKKFTPPWPSYLPPLKCFSDVCGNYVGLRQVILVSTLLKLLKIRDADTIEFPNLSELISYRKEWNLFHWKRFSEYIK